MKDYAIQLLTKMLEIYSPSGKEEAISSFLADEMKKLGFNVKQDNVGNVIGEIGQGNPVIFLCGHMDTVAGFIPVQKTNNKLYGRGAVDAKASLAAMIVASSALKGSGLGKIIVAGVVDEEGRSRGIKNLLKEGINTDYAIFGEPSGVEKITVGYKGLLRLKIMCKTETGHSAANVLYENAVEKAFEVWNEIKKKIHFPSDKPESPFYSVTSSLTKISGGRGNSTIPDSCKIQIDIRVPPQFTTAQIFEKISKLIEQYKEANPKISVNVKVKDAIEPFEADSTSLIIKALSKSIREVRRKTATILRKTGTGDMNIFGKAVKIPVVTYGPGDPTLSHTENEHIALQEYIDSIEVYKKTLTHIVDMHLKRS